MMMSSNQIAKSLSSNITLNDGSKMPMFGLGTWLAEPEVCECEGACLKALSEGYRMIDTAQVYNDETEVGNAVRNSGLKREDIFVVSKIDWDTHGTEEAGKSIEESLKKLNIGYIDLFLVHTPQYGKVLETYDEIVKFQKKGLIKSIGVSNFGIHHLEGLKAAGRPTPAVNQFELHPWWQRKDLVQYCQQNGIAVMGYCPLVRGKKLGDEKLTEIAERYNKSTAQLLIRWGVQKGYITIPKSTKPERIVENAQVFDFTISDEDMSAMDFKDQASCTGSWQPVDTPWIQ